MTTPPFDITEDVVLDLSISGEQSSFTPTNIAYDIAIGNIPFVLDANNQSPYRRETAQYKKDQFDNAAEPGEQSLLGWWLRSQSSFHNGAGINYYEPGTDFANVSNRFNDSNGVDVWTPGEVKLLNSVFHSYSGANNIVSEVGSGNGDEFIITGDSLGALKRVTLNGDLPATATQYTLHVDHTSSNPFKSVTSDGTRYYAVCDKAIHIGRADGTPVYTSGGTNYYDLILARHTTGGLHTIKYAKGYIMFGEAERLYYIPVNADLGPLVNNAHTGGETLDELLSKRHINPNFIWNTIEGGNRFIYAGGYAGGDSEIWAIPFDDASLAPDPASAIQVVQLPYGEIINCMYFYLGYLAIGTNRGLRIGTVGSDGSVTVGPILFDTDEGVKGIVANDKFIWAATSIPNEAFGVTNAVLVRVDLSSPYQDGTFPYANDLQYYSDEDSYGLNVHYADERLHMIVNEGGASGEIQTQHSTNLVESGWLRTGFIRYNTLEPKFFKYINTRARVGVDNGILVSSIADGDTSFELITLTDTSANTDIGIRLPSTKQEVLGFKFTLLNGGNLDNGPIFTGYQVKSIPAAKRQRLIQYPLQCYDTEKDRFDVVFGYSGRAYELVTSLELLEEQGNVITITDFRLNETFKGIVEEVRFVNESSPDRDSAGFGGKLLVTVRKI
jgi:hypothetical protein